MNESKVAGMWVPRTDCKSGECDLHNGHKIDEDGKLYRLNESPEAIAEARQEGRIKQLENGYDLLKGKLSSIIAENEKLRLDNRILLENVAGLTADNENLKRERVTT